MKGLSERDFTLRPPRLLGAGLVLVGTALACHGERSVATVLEAQGVVERSPGTGWQPASRGQGLYAGDVLRTGAKSGARLRFANGGSVVRVGENARIRFQSGAWPGGAAPEMGVERGSAEISEAATEISVVTVAGRARVERGSHVRVRAEGDVASFEVLVGRAVMIESDHEVAIQAGQGVRIRIGGAVVERFRLKVGTAVIEPGGPGGAPAPVAVAGPADAGTETARAAGGSDAGPPPVKMGPEIAAAGPEPSPARPVPAAEPAPSPARPAPAAEPEPPAARQAAAAEPARAEESRADVTVRAGESAIFHDGSGSLTLRLRFDGLCSGDGIVEVRRKGGPRRRLVGSGAVIVRLQEREGTYLVRCQGDAPGDKPRASGVLALRRDSGNVPLPRRAPTNVIDADGRRYTVLFQTRPPTLTLAWPKAPGGTEGVELHLQSASGERLIPAGAARHQLASGALAEGTHTFWYTTGEGYASPRSTVTLRFDNTAPTAQFFRATSAPESPDGIQVDGVTIEGAKVSASGAPLPVDDQGRFRAEVAPLPGDDAVAVRLEHPRGGVHYYIRRRSGAATR